MQMCIDVERRLREVYGELVLGAHDLSARALLEQEGQGKLGRHQG